MITLEENETVTERARRILSGGLRFEDYLPLTDEIKSTAEGQIGHIRERMQANASDELVRCKQREALLIHYHGGEHIAYVEDENGIAVIAVGLKQIAELLENIPAADRPALILTRPFLDSE